MKIILLLCFLQGFLSVDFDVAMEKLAILEKYIRHYIEDLPSNLKDSYTLTELITTYIREGVYLEDEWKKLLGEAPGNLDNYISEKEEKDNTNVREIRTYREINLPNNEIFDFGHLFGTMNGIYKKRIRNTSHLCGWGGDTTTLIVDIMDQTGDLTYLMNKAKEFFGKKGNFDSVDLITDLDAPIILNKKNDNNYFSEIIKEYYNSNEYENRISNFVRLTFSKVDMGKKETFREYLLDLYNSDLLIRALEAQKGIRNKASSKGSSGEINFLEKYINYIPKEVKEEYILHQKAAVYVFADYIIENIKNKPKKNDKKCDIYDYIIINNNCIKKIKIVQFTS